MYCVHCGVQNVDDANFCSNCGKELSLSSTEEVVESRTDESQSEVRVHHPWMRVQQQPLEQAQEETQQQIQEEARQVHHPWMAAQEQPQEQVKEEIQHEAQEQEQGEVPKALKSILNRVQGWSTKKKVLWGIVAFSLLMVCAAAIAGDPVEEDGAANNKPLESPKGLVTRSEMADNPGKIPDYHWHEAELICSQYEGEYPDYSEARYNQMIDEAHTLSQKLGVSMPTFSELNNLQSVYAATLASSDTWPDAYYTHEKVKKMFNESSINILKEKFGTSNRLVTKVDEWVRGNDGSAERAQYQHYADNVRMLWGWFHCGTAKLQ